MTASSQVGFNVAPSDRGTALPTAGKKERDAVRDVRADFRFQRFDLVLEQGSQQHGDHDEVEEEAGRCCEALGREGWQRCDLAGSRHLTQEAGRDFRTKLTR